MKKNQKCKMKLNIRRKEKTQLNMLKIIMNNTRKNKM